MPAPEPSGRQPNAATSCVGVGGQSARVGSARFEIPGSHRSMRGAGPDRSAPHDRLDVASRPAPREPRTALPHGRPRGRAASPVPMDGGMGPLVTARATTDVTSRGLPEDARARSPRGRGSLGSRGHAQAPVPTASPALGEHDVLGRSPHASPMPGEAQSLPVFWRVRRERIFSAGCSGGSSLSRPTSTPPPRLSPAPYDPAAVPCWGASSDLSKRAGQDRHGGASENALRREDRPPRPRALSPERGTP
jgi:hypothetical protein